MESAYRICLIEDDENLGEALVERLEMDGYACTWHRRGADARRDLQKTAYDIAISDIQLPDTTGGELFESLQRSGVASATSSCRTRPAASCSSRSSGRVSRCHRSCLSLAMAPSRTPSAC
jgi:CheY-like chemotaxis protein